MLSDLNVKKSTGNKGELWVKPFGQILTHRKSQLKWEPFVFSHFQDEIGRSFQSLTFHCDCERITHETEHAYYNSNQTK